MGLVFSISLTFIQGGPKSQYIIVRLITSSNLTNFKLFLIVRIWRKCVWNVTILLCTLIIPLLQLQAQKLMTCNKAGYV